MDAQSTEPNAFQSLLAEHVELMNMLEETGRALQERTAGVEAIATLLARLGDRLVKHFALEEEGGYFSEALLCAPQLISKANQLLAQHPYLCAQAERLKADLENRDFAGQDWWQQTWARFCEFRDELMKHEKSENRLLQEAYGRDVGSHD